MIPLRSLMSPNFFHNDLLGVLIVHSSLVRPTYVWSIRISLLAVAQCATFPLKLQLNRSTRITYFSLLTSLILIVTIHRDVIDSTICALKTQRCKQFVCSPMFVHLCSPNMVLICIDSRRREKKMIFD